MLKIQCKINRTVTHLAEGALGLLLFLLRLGCAGAKENAGDRVGEALEPLDELIGILLLFLLLSPLHLGNLGLLLLDVLRQLGQLVGEPAARRRSDGARLLLGCRDGST